MPTVSQREDIKSLIERIAHVRVVSEATVRNVREYHSNCPWCPGSHDSFIMCPETGRYSHAIRSGCGRAGDAIDFLVDYCEMERYRAIEELGLEHVSFCDAKPEPVRTRLDPPSEKWQETGKNFVERAAYYLWGNTSSAREALAYLRGRGLEDETIRRKKFGYCPLQNDGQWYGADPLHGGLEHWGLKPEDVSEKIAERGTIRIAPGIVIPWYESDVLWKIAVKRYGQPKPHDYGEVAGSMHGLYNVDSIQPGKPCMIVEAEFCAAAVEQCAGDLVGVVGTGSDVKGRNPRFAPKLLQASCLPQAFDNDEPDVQGRRPGDVGAVWWLCRYDYCFRHKPVEAKDPNDMLQVHGDAFVRDWVQMALDKWEGYRQSGIIAGPLARVS